MTNHNEKGKPMFNSAAEYYDRNLKDAQNFHAKPATIGTPAGEYVPGVILKNGKGIRAVMPLPEALRLANQIADAIQAHRAAA